jgi:O-acetyl-ADP-ribose deacetylase (regulator of RNase III)
MLASCYRRAIELGEEVACTSIAFPAISCGVYRYPAEQAVEIAVGTVIDMLPQAPNLLRVVFACFSSDIFELYRAQLARV